MFMPYRAARYDDKLVRVMGYSVVGCGIGDGYWDSGCGGDPYTRG
jgi:hypothetical protein